MTAALILKFLRARWKWVTGGVLLLVILSVVFFQWQCGTSRREEKLENLENQAIEQKPVERTTEEKAATKERQAEQLDAVAKEKVEKAKEARNANTKNSSYEDANRNRCRAYPEDSECE